MNWLDTLTTLLSSEEEEAKARDKIASLAEEISIARSMPNFSPPEEEHPYDTGERISQGDPRRDKFNKIIGDLFDWTPLGSLNEAAIANREEDPLGLLGSALWFALDMTPSSPGAAGALKKKGFKNLFKFRNTAR